LLNPIWLNTFATLIDTGHFTQTAEKLFMTQPGVTQHINKLEQACGYALIDRQKKRFEITEQGRLVYQYAMQLRKNEQQLIEQLAFDNPYAGQCSIACSGALVLSLYPPLLSLQVKHPDLVIKLIAAPNHQIIDDIQQGKIDVGIVTDAANASLFDVREIGFEELCLVMPAGVNAAQNKADLVNQLGLIGHPDAQHYLSLYCSTCQEPALKQLNIADITLKGFVNQISQILQPVAQGLGFTVLPKSVIDSFDRPQLLQLLKPAQPVVETLYLLKKKNRTLAARFDLILDKIEQVMAD